MTAHLFSIIGDGNVLRNMTGLNMASREVMKSAQVIDCTKITVEEAFQQVRVESAVCIFGAITEPLLANGFCGTIFATVDSVLTSIYTSISTYCMSHPAVQVHIFIHFLY